MKLTRLRSKTFVWEFRRVHPPKLNAKALHPWPVGQDRDEWLSGVGVKIDNLSLQQPKGFNKAVKIFSIFLKIMLGCR